MFSPCKGCEDRREGCHAECEKYLAFREYCKQKQKERNKDANVRDYFGQRKVKIARCFKRRMHGSHHDDS